MSFQGVWQKLSKHLGLSTAGAMLAGVVVGFYFRPEFLRMFIPAALFVMLYPMMLEVKLEDLGKLLRHPGMLAMAIASNFVLSPLIMVGISHVFNLPATPVVMVGLFLFASIPCGGMVPAFTGMLNGNVSLAVTISTSSYLLCIGIVPLWTKILIGEMLPIPLFFFVKQLSVMIVLPLVLADITRRLITKRKGERVFQAVKEKTKVFSSLSLIALVFIVFVLNGRQIINDPSLILKIVFPVFSFLMMLLVFSNLSCKIVRTSREDAVAYTFSTCAKNNVIAIALALTTFGTDVALINAIAGPMVQLPFMLSYLNLVRSGAVRIGPRTGGN